MNTFNKTISCPHCGSNVIFEFDASNGDQNYYEECPACCNDIHMGMHLNDALQKVELTIDADDEQFY
jgi:transcription elongation factor Elf1